MIKSTDKNHQKLQSLFQKCPELFKVVEPSEYEDAPELLYCDGEADLIDINGQTYRFYWESVEEFGIEQ